MPNQSLIGEYWVIQHLMTGKYPYWDNSGHLALYLSDEPEQYRSYEDAWMTLAGRHLNKDRFKVISVSRRIFSYIQE